jgi:hypothetical protein
MGQRFRVSFLLMIHRTIHFFLCTCRVSFKLADGQTLKLRDSLDLPFFSWMTHWVNELSHAGPSAWNSPCKQSKINTFEKQLK